MKRKCEDCEYWETNDRLEECNSGRCHRNPPIWIEDELNFVYVKKNEWCGEFELKTKAVKFICPGKEEWHFEEVPASINIYNIKKPCSHCGKEMVVEEIK